MYTGEQHTFAICAYKESAFLEDAIKSVKHQSVKSNIIMVTSTPNALIEELSKKYDIPLFINDGEAGIAGDWNFGYQKASTELVTICHQDDIYEKHYVEKILQKVNRSKKPLIAFTDYGELRNGEKVFHNTLLKIKRVMLLPLRISLFENSIWVRRRILSFGSPICCPAVTFVKKNLPPVIFKQGFKSDVDWEAWEMISKLKGGFVYVKEPLMLHRIHEESATTEIIGDSLRNKEDYQMFCKFWPKWIAKRICAVYKNGEKSNQL